MHSVELSIRGNTMNESMIKEGLRLITAGLESGKKRNITPKEKEYLANDNEILSTLNAYFPTLTFPIVLISIRSGLHPTSNPTKDPSSHINECTTLIRSEFNGSLTYSCDSEILVFLPVTGNPGADEDKIKRLFVFLEKHGLRGGASRPIFDLEGFSAFHLQACKAWETGESFEDNAPLYNYDNYAVYHLLEYGSTQHDLMTFCHTSIFILAEYDASHRTDLLETLNVYLNCHCNAAEAASMLYIHRNTMNYRLSKINELTNIDLDNTESFFHLLLSFHILAYYSLTVSGDDNFKKHRNLHLTRPK